MAFKAKDKDINFIIPPHGVTVTFHILSKCRNNCPFCFINDTYYKDTQNFDKLNIIDASIVIANDDDLIPLINNFVISGGEPFDDLDFTLELAERLHNYYEGKKPIYINTQLPEDDKIDFSQLSKLFKYVNGISISRHAASEDEEEFSIKGVNDNMINFIADKVLPIRINCVLIDKIDIAGVVKRWKDSNVTVSFRRDYNYTNTEDLHKIDKTYLMECLYHAGFTGYIQVDSCNICDTKRLIWKEPTTAKFYLHSGLRSTCLMHTFDGIDYFELHDVVVLPDGRLFDNWNIESAHELCIRE